MVVISKLSENKIVTNLLKCKNYQSLKEHKKGKIHICIHNGCQSQSKFMFK